MEKPRIWLSSIGIQGTFLDFWRHGHVTHGEHRSGDLEVIRSEKTHAQPYEQQSPPDSRHASPRMGGRLLGYLTRLVSLLWFLIPRGGRPVRKKAIHELHALSYLDALRGYLALIIFTGHTMSRRWRWIPEPILAVPWLQFPFRGGHTALDIFFWISGYAVTYRIIGFMQSNKADRALDALVSSMFRRYPRLFLPMVFTQFITVVAIVTGIAILPDEKADLFGGSNPFVFFLKDTAQALSPFAHVVGYWTKKRAGPQLLDQFWSINTEFRSSMILFMFCTATCKMTTRMRQRLIWVCIPVFVCWQVQWAAMAFLGMWFAERRQQKVREQALPTSRELIPTQTNPELAAVAKPALPLDTSHDKPEVSSPQSIRFPAATWKAVKSRLPSSRSDISPRATLSYIRQPLLLLLFLYSFSYVKDPRTGPYTGPFPHNLLRYVTPDTWPREMKMHLHLIFGAFMMLYPLDQLPALQRPLLSPFSQYLGELSFGIYAMHFTVRWIVWDPRYVAWQKDAYGRHDFDFFWILFPGYVVMTITVLWAAELFRRVDMRIVTFCKDLEQKMFA